LASRRKVGFRAAALVKRNAAAALADKRLPLGRPVDIDLKHWWDFGVLALIVQRSALRIRLGDDSNAIDPRAGAPTCVINGGASFNGFARDPNPCRSSADSKTRSACAVPASFTARRPVGTNGRDGADCVDWAPTIIRNWRWRRR
jgi:hypothetical protein